MVNQFCKTIIKPKTIAYLTVQLILDFYGFYHLKTYFFEITQNGPMGSRLLPRQSSKVSKTDFGALT